jgi:alkylation response protein AidB-like acyl-CoA dehydrogenase
MSFDALAARFRPIFDSIAAGAVRREAERLLPYDEVDQLKRAGFGALRVPTEFGGDDVSLVDLFRLLIELGEADSNLPQLLRGHVAFVETQRGLPASPVRDAWLRSIASRDILFGNAQAERSDTSTQSATLEHRDGRLVLNGRKYYSTGTLFADWVWSGAQIDGEFVAFAVKADAAGVTRIDDWDGFGQRLTGSGTTIFEDVEIDPDHVLPWDENDAARPLAYTLALYQLILLASLAGIGRAVLRDAVDFVRPRTRTFGVPGTSSPRDEPLVQRVIGRLASIRFAVEATVVEAVRRIEDVDVARRGDRTDEEQYYTALVAVFEAQQVVIDLVQQATTQVFEVGGASATSVDHALDRFWRNARTISSHNPAIYREKAIGDFYLNGTLPKSQLQLARTSDARPAPVG